MKLSLIICFMVLYVFSKVTACHSPLHYAVKKRDTSTVSDESTSYNATELIDFFTDCMTMNSNISFDWYSATTWTINDSYWFYYTENNDCADEDSSNETNCWVLNVDGFFEESISPTVKQCIQQYAIDHDFPTANETLISKRKKRSILPSPPLFGTFPEIQIPNTNFLDQIRNSECPPISETYEVELEQLIPPDRKKPIRSRQFNISNVVNFVDLYTSCTECERYSGEPAVDCFTNRLDLLTRPESSIKSAIQIANAKFANGGNTVGNCKRDTFVTRWFDIDSPNSGDGDIETLAIIKSQFPSEVCDIPTGIRAELSNSGKPFGRGNDTLFISPVTGLICLNADQTDGICKNYRVQFCCQAAVGQCSLNSGWTPFYSVSKPNRQGEFESLERIRSLNQGRVCPNPTAVKAELINGTNFQLTGEILQVIPELGLSCFADFQEDQECNNYQVQFCCPSRIGHCAPGHYWTKWYNNGLTDTGDDESLRLLQQLPGWECMSEPSAVNVQIAKTRRPYIEGNNRFLFLDKKKGLRCLNSQQKEGKRCKNYRISFCCLQN